MGGDKECFLTPVGLILRTLKAGLGRAGWAQLRNKEEDEGSWRALGKEER